ncbi:dynein heavy chain domain-containing protein 1-like isoform X5 [Mya arenaria]|uniref:dynein heavy chain domain-containing protein 1-like isoform X5 n=1 Tax=Mya arenaria TaxID=6604 RepID=UPI0022E7A1F2|nr:dynein heavy chain domain-containing protein 1-like isoform X5 [Mya arenaria]
MSQQAGIAMEMQTSPKLPALREGQSSLVCSPDKVSSPPTPREQASEWAKPVRQRIEGILAEQGDIPDELKCAVYQELFPVFIVCLQQDTRHGWRYLTEVLDLLKPVRTYIELDDVKSELYHYLERLLYHAQLHREKLFDLHIVDSLEKVFPNEVSQIKTASQRKVRNYCVAIPNVRVSMESSSPRVKKMVPGPPNLLSLPDGSNPYSMYINTEEQIRMVKPLTFGDLRKSLATVAVDMATRESIWSHTLGPVAQALQTDIPEHAQKQARLTEKDQGGYKLTPRTSISHYTAAERKFKKSPRVEDEEVPNMTGRDAVAYFVKCHHLGNVRSLFFNFAPSRYFKPYDLVCVHKNDVQREHFVFSTFGVLHVLPDAPAESLTLAEWQRDAVLWKAVSHIPFFRNYLIRKMFDRWRANKLYLDYLRHKQKISTSLLQNVPVFGAALLQVLRLLKELITVTFLPFDTDKMYQLSDFENNVNYKNIQAEKILEKFFTYCKMVVDKTAEESFNKLRYCEEQVKKKTYFSKDSLHMQKFKKEQREENLRLARSETGRLGNFVKLVDQMIVEHMFHLTKTQVTLFVTTVLDIGQIPLRDGFFKANLVYTKQDVLGIFPTKEKLTRVLTSTLRGIPTVLCGKAVPMDGSIQEPQTDRDGLPEETESTHLKSEAAKSISDYRPQLSERRKSTAATSSVKQESRTQMSEGVSQAGDTMTVISGALTERTIPMSKTRSTVGDDSDMRFPEMPSEDTQTKDEDEIGIATPDLVIPHEGQNLLVEGEGFMGQYQPLSRASLEEKLDKDCQFQEMLGVTNKLLNESLEEIDQYCDFNKWLNEIHAFCKRWTEKSVREFKGEQAFTIEQKLTELRQWSEKVQNFDHSFHTANGLFYVDCSHIHDNLLPRLNDIYSELVTFVAEEAKNLADNFCTEMKTVIANMKNKEPEVDMFATYAKNYNQYKKNTASYQQKVEYIKSLYEVIRMSYRQLTSEEEKYEENVWAAWEAFLLQMQDASEFVNTQTPLMTQLLEDTYQKLEREAYELEEAATNGKFLDPDQNPTAVLMDMKHIRDKFYDIQTQLHKASKWREAICGEPYDLAFLTDMMVKLDVRQELWKYVEVSTHAIKDWKSMLFKKMNIKKALEKVIEWQSAVGQLKPYLPPQDRVLTSWFKMLQDFKKDLPVLHKLANDALKERHWKAIFVGMNESYDPKKQFTVSDLLTYDLKDHEQLVNQIYLGAVAEYDLEQKIGHMKKFWLEREFKLAKHIPDSLLASKEIKLRQLKEYVKLAKEKRAEPSKKPSSPRRRTKLEKYRQEKARQDREGAFAGLNVADDDYYILIEVEELKYQLEDSMISIAGMMQSPYLGDNTAEVESRCSALQQVEEITDLWYTCQKKWMYLLKVFEWPQLYKRFKNQAANFEFIHNKFKNWMQVVSNDSKVLTVINRRRGEKGYRLMQGDKLRADFLELIQKQEEILKHLTGLMDNCRQEFTRLYFLSDEELVEMLGVSRNPQALTPFAKKCFPGIQSLAFALPPGTSSLNTHLDFALHADKLQVIAVRGAMGEELPFFAHLEAQKNSTRWLKLLESIMKNTVATILQACVQTRLEDGGKVQALDILEEMTAVYRAKSEQTEEDLAVELKHVYGHWMLRFPTQSVLVTEGILWSRAINRALEKEHSQLEDLRCLRTNYEGRLSQYVEILKEMHTTGASSEVQHRLQCLITVLVSQNIQHRDNLTAVMSEPEVNDKSFTWLRILRYNMDIRNVLRAKQEPIDPAPPPGQPDFAASRRAKQAVRRKSRKESFDSSPMQSLSRTKTSVSTDFQFSRCTVHQLGNIFHYDYEYLGPSERLVMTPLTERAFLSLTQAVKNFHCGTLIGPPGMGKSETVKDLAKVFGCCLYTISCNSEVTLHMMTQYMMGMVQSGCWALFDDTDRLTKGLMSVTSQHLDHLRTALRTLDVSSENQYKIRGQPRSDKKTGVGDAVIRRNSLTTLHPLPHTATSPQLERQKTVPHGFNEKGLVTYFEETWIAEKEQRRHSIEREIEIQESELYNKNKPPPLFYESTLEKIYKFYMDPNAKHARFKGKKASPDYSKLLKEAIYRSEFLGNIMFNGKLVQANANFGCFMTLNITNPAAAVIPETFRVLLRPCAMVQPDFKPYIEAALLCHSYQDYATWAQRLTLFVKLFRMQLPRKAQYAVGMRDIKMVLSVAIPTLRDLIELQHNETVTFEEVKAQTQTRPDTPPLINMKPRELEEQSIVQGLLDTFSPALETEDDVSAFLNILRDVFPQSNQSKSMSDPYQDMKLVNAVRDQLNEDNMKETPEIMEKILQLYSTIQQSESVIITGAAGSGKSTCLGVLARALNRLNYLLFAPDHSKEELTTDRGMAFHTKQKLQDLGMEEFIPAEEEFLSRLGAPKPESSKGLKKMKHATSILTKISEAIHELEVKKSPEYAMFPKIDLVRLNPTALSSQELLGQFKDGLWQGGLIQKVLRDASFMSDAVKTYLKNNKKQEQTKQKHKSDLPSVLLKWIVLDGVLHPNWTEGLNTVLDSERKLSMANGGHVHFNVESTKLLFEATDLTNISPSTIAHCNIIHNGDATVSWTSLFECWAKTAKSKWIFTSDCMKVIIDLALDIFGPTIKFLNSECTVALLTDVGHSVAMANRVIPGVQEVTSFVMMYSALLDRGYSRDEFEKKIINREPDEETKLIIISRHLDPHRFEKQKPIYEDCVSLDPSKIQTPGNSTCGTNSRMTSSSQIENNIPNYMEQMKGMFAMAYIWAFGGNLHDRHRDKFCKFAHDILYGARHQIRIPMSGSVFDFCLDHSTGGFIKWSQKGQEKSKNIAQGYVMTPEVEKYTFLVDLLVSSHQPVLLAGQPGVGKTSLIHNMVLPKQVSTTITMSPGMSSAIFQEAMMAHIIELKSKALNVITSGQAANTKGVQKHLFFIDDLNTAPKTEGYQPPLELLTQMLSQGGVYDRQRQQFQEMNEAIILAACTQPNCPGVGMGESCHVMSSRLTRLFMNLTLFFPSADGILSTFGRNIQHWLEEFPTYSVEHHFEFARALTLGLLELYTKVKEKFRPTPAHAHYVFTLHDISRVVQGILLMSPRSRTRKMMKIRKEKRGSQTTSRATSLDSRGRQSLGSLSNSGDKEPASPTPPMMKVIAQLWCHECTRTFADRLVTDEDSQWFGRILEEIVLKQFCSPREDPKVEMAAISEETFSQSQSGPASPRVTPPPPKAMTPSDTEGEQEEGDMDELGNTQRTSESESSKSEKSLQSQSLSRASQSTQGSMKKDSITDSSGDTQSGGLDNTMENEDSPRENGHTPAGAKGMVSETEYETEDSESDIETETETDTDTLTGTPRDLTGTMATTIDDSSRGTSRTSEFIPPATMTTSKTTSTSYKYSSQSTETSDSDQANVRHKRKTKFADDYTKSTPRFKKQFTQRGSISSRHVHFKPGLMTDKEHIAYFGPLIKLEEIKSSSDSLTDFLFSKFFMTTHTETLSMSIEKGYTDTTEDVLAEALQTCLNVYNLGTSQRLELVFFKQAIQHAARLSRVMALQGGHALLLGTSYSTGRATLVRLASYIAHCKGGLLGYCCLRNCIGLYEPKPQTDTSKNLRIVREHIKRACQHTGILGKPTVLLVHEDLGFDCLQDVAAVMAEGTSPGLYTEQEMQEIVSQMMPGGVQTKRIDKIEQAFERFLKRIKQHLHVVVCLSYRGNSFSSNFKSLHKVMSRFPNLLKYSCCVDHYQPWPYDAYVKIAKVWLQDERSRVHVDWHSSKKEDQVDMTSRAMAYVHMSAKVALERQYCHQREPLRFFSPLTFMEFVHIFRIICAYIVKRETGNIYKHEQALGKVNEAFGSIDDFRREVSNLSPQHKAATEEIKGLVEQVEAQKQDYIVALDKCKDQEALIEELQGPLERLRKDAQSEFDKFKKFKEEHGFADYYTQSQYRLNPNYKAAILALDSLNRQDLDEVKSFREPPELVKYVVNALCLLYDKPQDWENGKLLLTRENFVQDLIFYDKDNIPEEIFQELSKLVKEPMFQPELVMSVSKATAGICQWVHSVQKYSEIHRNMQPRLKNLLEHEEKFTKAQAKLGQLRVDANRLKSALERKIQVHKAAVKRAKTLYRQMQNIERKISRAVNLMENMSMQNFMWKSELRKAKHQIFTAPGDALITAACVCYQGPLSDKLRGELLQDWLDRCKQGNFTLPKSIGQEVYPLANGSDSLFAFEKQKDRDSISDASSSVETQSESGMPALPQVKTFRYQPVVYDTSKYYKSELKRHGSVEYEPPSNDMEDSDDEEEQSLLMTRNAYTLQDILSDFDELSTWRLEGLPTDLHSVQNSLLMRVSCYNRKHCWPLLIDPDNQAETWVKAIQTSRNIFSEKDVTDGDESDYLDLPPVPVSEEKDEGSPSPPPSRGTGITFSDYTVEYPPDDESTRRSSTTNTYTNTDYTKRDGSRLSFESEQLRPVTSVTASWEAYSLHPDSSIEHPEHNLWIIEADDPMLDSRLINAIVHGVTVLITHLERKPIDPLFRGLLLKHFYVDKDGNKVVRVGNYEFQYHPNFCLYLSTSVPLFLKGDGLHNVPIHRMCIINMALSDEAIINYLLHETMRVERKEFEGQKRSNENDIIRHRQKLAQEHEMIREKTLNLFGPILEDQTMLDSLINCQKEVERNKMILEETRYMGDHLEEKFSHYVPMIMQAAMLYSIIQRMSILHSYYYMPFYKFVEMFTGVIKARDRGKGTQGAPASRAKELSDAVYSNVFKYVSMMMFERHFLLLQCLVALERLRLNKKASNKELGIFLNGFDKQGVEEAALQDKRPDWIDPHAWVECLVLEQVHHAFHGLRRSLIANSEQWKEYFQHPVALMNTVPGTTMQDLFIFQKCLLWRFACPHRLAEVCQALILFELGSIRTVPDHYNIREVYDCTSSTTPVVFVLPNDKQDMEASEATKGLPYVSPSHEVKRLAKELGMEGKVKVMNFGVPGQVAEAKQAVEDCINTGNWLLLQNYHLAEEPEPDFFQLLKEIVYTKWQKKRDQHEYSSSQHDDQVTLVAPSRASRTTAELKIADTFRLWITTQSDIGRLIPGVLVQHGIKVTAESTGNFKSTLLKSYRSVAFLLNNFQLSQEETSNDKMARIMPLALLHSLLLQQCYYGNGVFNTHHHWSLTDLAMAVDVYKKVMLRCTAREEIPRLVAQTYTNHCTDSTDRAAVQALVQTLVQYATIPLDKFPSQPDESIVRLLQRLLHMDEGTFNLKRSIDSLDELAARTFGLPDAADLDVTAEFSSILSRDMVQVIGAPELFSRVTLGHSAAVIAREAIIPHYISIVQGLPLLPDTNRNQYLPLDVFLHYEAEGYRKLIETITLDLNLLQRKAKGEIHTSPELNEVIYAINRNKVPPSWTNQGFQSANSLSDWLLELSLKLKHLKSYIMDDKPATYNLSVFQRPDRFLESVKQTYARKQFKDIDSIEFKVEVMPAGLKPSLPPSQGVFISGLQLHNALWDITRAVMMQPTPDSPSHQDMPIFCLKPLDAGAQTPRRLYKLYRCPVYCTRGSSQHGDSSVVVHFSLPTLCEPSIWQYQRAFLSAAVPSS